MAEQKVEPIKFGVIGAGNSAVMMARDVSAISGIDMVVIYDTEPARLDRLTVDEKIPENAREYFNHVQQSRNLDEMLSRGDLTFVAVATPSGSHAQDGIKVAKAGIHPVIEKPVDVNLLAAQSLVDACKTNRVEPHFISQNRFKPDVLYAKKIIGSGDIGEIITVVTENLWYRNDAYYNSADWRGTWAMDGGGALMNQGIHLLDIQRYLVGSNLRWVRATAENKVHKDVIEVEDWLHASGQHESGAKAVILASTSTYGPDKSVIRIYGTKGALVLVNYEIDEEASMYETDGGLKPIESRVAKQAATGAQAVSDPLTAGGHGTQLLYIGRHLQGHPVENIQMIRPEDAMATLETILAIYKSVEAIGVMVPLHIDRAYKPNVERMKQVLG